MKCSVKGCNNDTLPRSKTGVCHKCLKKRYYDHNYRSPRNKVEAICYKCGENFKARYTQDPKYSYCPKCRKEVKRIGRGLEWMSRQKSHGRIK